MIFVVALAFLTFNFLLIFGCVNAKNGKNFVKNCNKK